MLRKLVFAGIAVAMSATALSQVVPRPNTAGQSDSTSARAYRQIVGMIPPDRDTPDSIRTYGQMLNSGRCFSGIGRKSAVLALGKRMNSSEERAIFADLESRLTACRTDGLPRTLSLIRGSLSEGLYHRLAKDASKAGLAPTDAHQAAFLSSSTQLMTSLEANDIPLARGTDCLAVQQPQIVHEVLEAKHGSAAEAQAMDRLFVAAPGCAGAKRPENISRSFLRAFLANSAYRAIQWSAMAGGNSERTP